MKDPPEKWMIYGIPLKTDTNAQLWILYVMNLHLEALPVVTTSENEDGAAAALAKASRIGPLILW